MAVYIICVPMNGALHLCSMALYIIYGNERPQHYMVNGPGPCTLMVMPPVHYMVNGPPVLYILCGNEWPLHYMVNGPWPLAPVHYMVNSRVYYILQCPILLFLNITI